MYRFDVSKIPVASPSFSPDQPCRAGFYALDYIPGFEREFDLTDTTIQHSFTVHERVPVCLFLVAHDHCSSDF